MKKNLLVVFAVVAGILLAGCGRDVPGDVKPIISSALSGEFGVPARCVAVKDVKKVEKDSFTAVALCDIGGREQSGGITVKYKDDKPVVGIIGFGYPEIRLVKNGVLGIDKTRTVEQMLSAKLNNLRWKSFSSSDNRRVVEVNGIWAWKYEKYKMVEWFPCDGDKVKLQFVIHVDGRNFNFAYGDIRDSNNKIKDSGHAATGSRDGYFSLNGFLELFTERI